MRTYHLRRVTIADEPDLTWSTSATEPANPMVKILGVRRAGIEDFVGRVMPQCTPSQQVHNHRLVQAYARWRQLADAVTSHANSFNTSSNELTQLLALIKDHDDASETLTHFKCRPSYYTQDAAYKRWIAAVTQAINRAKWAIVLVYRNAAREHAEMDRLMQIVAQRRNEFETSATGGQGLQGIRATHNQFLSQESKAQAFRLVPVTIDGTAYKPEDHFEEVQKTHDEERKYSAETELDRLRNEYVEERRPVPHPARFTQSAFTPHFSFAEFNKTNDYSWAVLNPFMVDRLEDIHRLMTEAGLPIQLNSAYLASPFCSDSFISRYLIRLSPPLL